MEVDARLLRRTGDHAPLLHVTCTTPTTRELSTRAARGVLALLLAVYAPHCPH